MVEPEQTGGMLGYIGARIDHERTTRRKAEPGDIRGNVQDTVFRFDLTPVEIPFSVYYRSAVVSGCLLPADAASAEICGVKFAPVDSALAASKAAAITQFDSNYGAGSYALVSGDVPPSAPPAPTVPPITHDQPAAVEQASEPATTKRKAS
jgi:hypothetical protein